MKIRLLLAAASLVVIILLLVYRDGRPTRTRAGNYFKAQHPELQLLSVESTENEVVACSFLFRYLDEDGLTCVHEIQFMQDPTTGKWRPDPKDEF